MATTPDNSASPASAALDTDVFDDDATIAQSGQLAPLLRLWNSLVRAEIGSVQSFPVYDQEAQKQQRWHQWLVLLAAITGSAAVLLAILQMARTHFFEAIEGAFEYGELSAAVLALIAVVVGLSVAFHTRWHLLRMKAEQYRFLKFHMLLHAGGWLKRTEHERQEELRTLLAGIHALDKEDAHNWSQGVFSLVDDDPAVIVQADGPLTEDIVRYFRTKRIGSQRDYFSRQAHRRHDTERKTWMIPPACFFLSIVCALVHFGAKSAGHSSELDDEPPAATASKVAPHHPPILDRLLMACLIGSAAFPVIGAMVRTMRTAFEFGRNANRFEGVARILSNVELQLQLAPSPAVQLELLREAEFVLQHENRSWMRLMIEAEWFG